MNVRTIDKASSPLPKLGVFSTGLAAFMIIISASLTHAAGLDTRTRNTTHEAALGVWAMRLIARLNEHKQLPPSGAGEGGTAKVAFRIDRAGNLLSARVRQSTGQAALDQEALAIVKRAQPFPAPPEDIADDKLSFVVPITFQGSPSICRGC